MSYEPNGDSVMRNEYIRGTRAMYRDGRWYSRDWRQIVRCSSCSRLMLFTTSFVFAPTTYCHRCWMKGHTFGGRKR